MANFTKSMPNLGYKASVGMADNIIPESMAPGMLSSMAASQILNSPKIAGQIDNGIAGLKERAGLNPDATPFKYAQGRDAMPKGAVMPSGEVMGQGTPTSDSIPAMVSNEEAILNAGAVMALKQLLGEDVIDRLNQQHAPEGAETSVKSGVLHAAYGYDPEDENSFGIKPNSGLDVFTKGVKQGAGIAYGGLKDAGNRLASGGPEYQSMRKEGYGVIPATLKTGANQFEQTVTPALNTVGAGVSSAYNTLFATPGQTNQTPSPPNLKQAAGGAIQNRPEQPAGRTLSGPGYSVSAQPGQFQGLQPITADSQNQLNNTIAREADPAFQQRLADENALVEARTGYGQQPVQQPGFQLQTAQPTADYSNEIDQLYSIINSRPPSGSFEAKLRHKKQVESALASLNQIGGLQNAAGQQALLGARDANQAQLGAAGLGLQQEGNQISRENAQLGALSETAKLAQQAQFEQAKLGQNRYNTRVVNPETGETITYAESGPAADESFQQQQQQKAFSDYSAAKKALAQNSGATPEEMAYAQNIIKKYQRFFEG